MSGYRFNPLRDFPRQGVLAAPGRKVNFASFWTPEAAKEIAAGTREDYGK